MYRRIDRKKFNAFGSTLWDPIRWSLSVDTAIGASNKSAIGASRVKFLSRNATALSDTPPFLQSKLNAFTVTSGHRYYYTDYRPFPNGSDIPPVVSPPNLFKCIKNLINTYLIIKPRFDSDFSLGEFVMHSSKAVCVVSGCIAKKDFSTLQGLVTNDVLEQLKSMVSNLSDEEIKFMAFKYEDVCTFFPFQLDIIKDTKLKDRRFVEISMCYHVVHNLAEINKKRFNEIDDIQKELKSKMRVLNYRFIREYTEGVNDAWTINAIYHLSFRS